MEKGIEIKRKIISIFTNDLLDYLKKVFLSVVGQEYGDFNLLFKNTINSNNLNNKMIEEIMDNDALNIFIIDYLSYKNICLHFSENIEFNHFERVLKTKMRDIFKEYLVDKNYFDDFCFQNYLDKINDEYLKIRYKVIAASLAKNNKI